MSRTVKEWRGKNDDTPVPPRVKLRVFERQNDKCVGCRRNVVGGWECDHIIALCNGGQHRESNLQMLCDWCHKIKTADDVAEKKKVYATRKAHIGLRPTTKRPMPHGKKSATKRKMTGEVVRR